MDENISKYLKTYGVFGLAVVLTIVLAVFQWIIVLRVLLVLLSALLVGAILLQQSKGGGLVGALGGLGGDSAFGTSATPIKKFTAFLAVLFLIMVLALSKAQQRAARVLEADIPQVPAEAPLEGPSDDEAQTKESPVPVKTEDAKPKAAAEPEAQKKETKEEKGEEKKKEEPQEK